MKYATLQRLNALQDVNNTINNPYGSTLNKEWQEIEKLINQNIDTVMRSKSMLEPTQKELHLTLMDIRKQLQEDEASQWHTVDTNENTLNDYQRITLRNQKTGESFETTVSNYSRSWQKAKYEKTAKPRSNFRAVAA